jgi:septal ring factor EnvC (AmiA/AmiB activator)
MLSALQAKVGELESEITQMKEEKDVLSQRYLAQKSELDTVLNALAQEQKEHAKSRDALQSLTATNADLNNAMKEIEVCALSFFSSFRMMILSERKEK